MAVLITYLFLTFSGGSPAFLDFISDRIDDVKAVVVNNEQQKEAVSILELMGEHSKEHNKQTNEINKKISKLIESRDAKLSEIIAIGDSNFENIESYSNEMLELRFKLKEHVTREEWAQIFIE
ncbi:hypothetical protein VIN01S_16350 [Vibrio inusitatus NBRC 102082]|uniref:Uncharacterized protein n=1 Tax=Vibrio inusitatus NBRC 102082 TaxID=1219070 RepID=A0A4Y3HV27_9VIBR|nr:hypothetical protein [Vibrio inusitatus]GEA50831.1 hypothetical protein VIN01S_16350 [Vibrio inusitatus NBRC 102082]